MTRTIIAASLAFIAWTVVAAAQSAACAPSGGLTFICGVANPEDLVLVPNTRWMLASGMAPGGGLHLVDTRAKTVKPLYAAGTANTRADKTKYASCPGPLDPKQACAPWTQPSARGGRPLHRVCHESRRP